MPASKRFFRAVRKRFNTKTVLKEINCPHLDLFKIEGYWRFVYHRRLPGGKLIHEMRSSGMRFLNAWPSNGWVDQGRDFIGDVEGEYSDFLE